MARRKLTKKTSGGGVKDMPLRRSYERELKQELKYGDPREIRPRDRATQEEVRHMKLSPKVKQRIAEMDREIALNELGKDEVRLSQARTLNERAEEHMQTHGTDYTTALREVVKLSESGAAEPSVAEVERFMREKDIQDFGVAVRQVVADRGDQRLGGVRPTTRVTTAQEDAELKRIAKERGYGDI